MNTLLLLLIVPLSMLSGAFCMALIAGGNRKKHSEENAMIAICIIITAVVLCLFAGHAPDPEWYDNQHNY